ncbi:MAG TPA: DUF1232 domain-containing protein [Thermoanaerobaculia bacterium]|nr:DUF1232 domain-containing protein [Thermoanaerobaculia bacterium]
MEQTEEQTDNAMFDDEELSSPITSERADRFYDRMRESIRRFLDRKGKTLGTTGEYLLLAPDVFVLMWRLVNDARVKGKDKTMLLSGVAYFLFPLDIMPEALMGPLGFLDDLVFGVYLLNRVLNDTDVEVLREHWSGSEDVLTTIRKVLNAADTLVGKDFLGRFKKS